MEGFEGAEFEEMRDVSTRLERATLEEVCGERSWCEEDMIAVNPCISIVQVCLMMCNHEKGLSYNFIF